MRNVVFGFIGLLALQAPVLAATPAACDAVARDWQAAAFSSPAKPAQARVQGSVGYETSGPGYRQMMQAIRHACATADQTVATQQAGVAEALLRHGKDGL
jgi:hypothetical protein